MSERILPLFPLPLVLFPGVPLPLHIFEPRYRRMLADCLRGDREFGILLRTEELEERALPRGHVGCVARVDNAVALSDGRSNILAVGVRRFALERFLDRAEPYHVGEVSPYEDIGGSGSETGSLVAAARGLFERVGRAARTLADDRDPLPALPDDPALLAFAIASYIDLDAARRQELLVSRSVDDRLRTVGSLLAPAVDGFEARAAVHLRARSNGHGAHPAA